MASKAGPGREPVVLLILTGSLVVISGISPYDRLTWLLEVLPILVGVPLLVFTAARFPLTPLTYRLIFAHAAILILGAHYTYEHVPPGNWVKEALNLSRNHYDRLGHFVQGFVPAIIAREVMVRRSPVKQGGWLIFNVTCFCLAFSAAFELFEWGTAVTLNQAADAYLATQGDPWDTQWDMFLALVGALVSQLMLARLHDRQVAVIGVSRPSRGFHAR